VLDSADKLNFSSVIEQIDTVSTINDGQAASVLVRQNVATPQGSDGTGATGGAYLTIPIATAMAFSGRTVRVRVRAKSNGAGQAGIAYSTNNVGNSGVQVFTPTADWAWHEITYDVPTATLENVDQVGLYGDISGGGASTLFSRVVVEDVTAKFAALEKEGMVWAESDGTPGATYTIRLRASDADGGAQTGFGLGVVKENGNWVSDVRFSADRFAIMSPADYTEDGALAPNDYPFIVKTTSEVIDGDTYPAGVYINDAYILGGTIRGSAIVDGTIKGTKLIDVSANLLTADYLINNVYIASGEYLATGSGWKIDSDGTAIFGKNGGARLEWSGTNVLIYDDDNELVLSSGSNTSASTGNKIEAPLFEHQHPQDFNYASPTNYYDLDLIKSYEEDHERWGAILTSKPWALGEAPPGCTFQIST